MKKSLSVIGVLMMFSMIGFAMAQDPISNVNVAAGQTVLADFGATTTSDSTTLGGLLSQIVETNHHVVKLNGVVISDKVNTTKINNFSLYVFGTGAQINYQNLISGDVYQQSESNIVARNVTGTWITYKVNSTTTTPSGDKAAGLNENFTAKDGTFVKVTSYISGANQMTFSTGQITLTQFQEAVQLCGGLTSAQAGILSGSSSPKDTYCGQYGTVKVIGVGGTTGGIPVRFLFDLDNDGDFNDTVDHVIVSSGYKVNAQQGQALALIPASIYDIFAVI